MPVWLAVLLGCAGAGLLAYWVWLRLGRTAYARSWARGTERNAINAMCGIPAVGFALVGVALTGPAADGSGIASAVSAVCLVLMLVIGTWGGLQIPVPLWSLPRWARAEVTRRREAEKQIRARKKQTR